jgi:hypothetical protein
MKWHIQTKGHDISTIMNNQCYKYIFMWICNHIISFVNIIIQLFTCPTWISIYFPSNLGYFYNKWTLFISNANLAYTWVETIWRCEKCTIKRGGGYSYLVETPSMYTSIEVDISDRWILVATHLFQLAPLDSF